MSNYNLTNLTSSNTTLEFAIAANEISGGAFFTIISIAILLIAFVAMKNFDTKTAFMSASFISTTLSSILWSVGLLAEATLLIHFVILLISVFLKATE